MHRRPISSRLAFWVTLLITALIFQLYTSYVIGPFQASGITMVLLVIITSVIYSRLLLCSCKQHNNTRVYVNNTQGDSFESPSNHLLSNANITSYNDDAEENHAQATTTPPIVPADGVGGGGRAPEMEDSSPLILNRPAPRRLYFLDNIKSFLTLCVVSVHLTAIFVGNGIGPGEWPLAVGDYKNSFRPFTFSFLYLNQGYFMSLFFFISGYFVPSSLKRKGQKDFLKDKAKRYWIPAMFVFLVEAPFLLGYPCWFVDKSVMYIPSTLQAWYLFWLLLLDFVYVHICGEDTNNLTTSTPEEELESNPSTTPTNIMIQDQTLPGPFARAVKYGIGVCGIGTIVVSIMTQSQFFFGMPISVGSLPNDLLFFAAGIIAKKNGWLERGLKEQIGIPIYLLRCMVIVEGALMVYSFYVVSYSKGEPSVVAYLTSIGGIVLISGMYCIDVSLVVLEFFQTHLDFQNRFTKFLSDAAYTVYIIHPVFLLGMSILWIKVYESVTGEELEWENYFSIPYSVTPIDGGGLTLCLSWFVSNILTNLILWPCAWYLKQLPGLRQIL